MNDLQFILFCIGYAILCSILGYLADRCIKPINRLLTKWGF